MLATCLILVLELISWEVLGIPIVMLSSLLWNGMHATCQVEWLILAIGVSLPILQHPCCCEKIQFSCADFLQYDELIYFEALSHNSISVITISKNLWNGIKQPRLYFINSCCTNNYYWNLTDKLVPWLLSVDPTIQIIRWVRLEDVHC